MSGGSLTIRPVRPGEAPLALQFIRELAEYEKLTDECVATDHAILGNGDHEENADRIDGGRARRAHTATSALMCGCGS